MRRSPSARRVAERYAAAFRQDVDVSRDVLRDAEQAASKVVDRFIKRVEREVDTSVGLMAVQAQVDEIADVDQMDGLSDQFTEVLVPVVLSHFDDHARADSAMDMLQKLVAEPLLMKAAKRLRDSTLRDAVMEFASQVGRLDWRYAV